MNGTELLALGKILAVGALGGVFGVLVLVMLKVVVLGVGTVVRNVAQELRSAALHLTSRTR